MKTFKVSSILVLTAGIFLSSCSHVSTFSVTKRHYRPGYYVEYAGKLPTPSKKQVEHALPQPQINNAKVAIVPVGQKQIAPYVFAKNEIKQSDKDISSSAAIVHSSKSMGNALPASNESSSKPSQNSKLLTNVILNSTNSMSDDNGRRSGLSIFWIVILIILILWLLGFLSGGWGLGPLINVLLIIALILLILWLLRVV